RRWPWKREDRAPMSSKRSLQPAGRAQTLQFAVVGGEAGQGAEPGHDEQLVRSEVEPVLHGADRLARWDVREQRLQFRVEGPRFGAGGEATRAFRHFEDGIEGAAAIGAVEVAAVDEQADARIRVAEPVAETRRKTVASHDGTAIDEARVRDGPRREAGSLDLTIALALP